MRTHSILSKAERERLAQALRTSATTQPVSQGAIKDALTSVAKGNPRKQLSPSAALAVHIAAQALGMPVPRVQHLRVDAARIWPELTKEATGEAAA